MADASTTRIERCIDRLNAAAPSARDELIQLTCKRLQRVTRKMLQDFRRLRSWDDTDDVLQSAMMRPLRALESVKPATAAEFFRLAALQIRRELIDLARRRDCRPQPDAHHSNDSKQVDGARSEVRVPDKTDSWHDPAKLAGWCEFHEQVEALPVKERSVFDLLWYHGMTQEEAAKVLNISNATLKRWWLAARLRLQDRLRGRVPVS